MTHKRKRLPAAPAAVLTTCVECVLILGAHEVKFADDISVHGEVITSVQDGGWHATKSIFLPFIPRKGTTLSNFINVVPEEQCWNDDPLGIEGHGSAVVDTVEWDCSRCCFILELYTWELMIPVNSDAEKLSQRWPGWRFTKGHFREDEW